MNAKSSIISNCNSDSYQEQFDRFYINFKAKKTQNLMNYPVFTSKGLQFSSNLKNSKVNDKKLVWRLGHLSQVRGQGSLATRFHFFK